MGVPVEYLYPRHTSVVEWMNKTFGYHPYVSGEISLLAGAALTEREVEQFKWVVQTYKPRVAVLMIPSGVDLADQMRNHVYITDGAQRGDVLAGVWGNWNNAFIADQLLCRRTRRPPYMYDPG